jgi:tRNA pseudouridine38-40 synthase
LSLVANHPVRVHCAGRTDAGVHAVMQVVHFETTALRSPEQWLLGTNSYLPADIRVYAAKPIAESFHARFTALSRRYFYIIHQHHIASALFQRYATRIPWTLDLELMQAAIPCLVGEQNFSAFRSSECQSRTPMRCVNVVSMWRESDLIIFDIKANAFLHHMVRLIVGHVIEIGRGRHSPESLRQRLDSQVVDPQIMMAPATGLYLVEVDYPPTYQLSQPLRVPWILHRYKHCI